MGRRRLHNGDWGLETNCFVCEQTNASGLRIAFYHDDGEDVVHGEFSLGPAYSGAPTLLHGGIVLAVLDEAQAWATIASAERFAMTATTTTRFLRAVGVDQPHRVEARVVGRADDRLETVGVILDARDRICAEAESTFTVLGEATATWAAGAELSEEARRHVRGPND